MPMTITVTDIRKFYGDTKAVDGVSFEVASGEFFGILGPNGAGKTTTLEIIEGLRKPDSGQVTLLGEQPWPRNPKVLPRIGVQLQASSFFDRLTTREQIRTWASLYGVGAKKADEMLDVVGLSDKANTQTQKLSGGQAQRLSIACALAHGPDVVFLDEPTSGLDPIGAGEFDDLIATLQRTLGLTVFMVTHDLDSLYSVCDRIAALGEGKILAEGPIETMLASDHPWLRSYFHGKRARAVMAGGA
jgi:ABC-2 type transport system ATP-binding protein